MRRSQQPIKKIPTLETSTRRNSLLSQLVSRVAVALAEIEAIQESRNHGGSKSRRKLAIYPAQ